MNEDQREKRDWSKSFPHIILRYLPVSVCAISKGYAVTERGRKGACRVVSIIINNHNHICIPLYSLNTSQSIIHFICIISPATPVVVVPTYRSSLCAEPVESNSHVHETNTVHISCFKTNNLPVVLLVHSG